LVVHNTMQKEIVITNVVRTNVSCITRGCGDGSRLEEKVRVNNELRTYTFCIQYYVTR